MTKSRFGRFSALTLTALLLRCSKGEMTGPEPQLTWSNVSAGHGDAEEVHSCGLTSSGVAYCWGDNAYGELGNGSRNLGSKPAAVAGGLRFISLTAGGHHTCGLTSGGAAYCWGDNSQGQIANGSDTCWNVIGMRISCALRPGPVAGGIAFASLTAGGYHTCGLTSNGAAYCWGANNLGQLGIGTSDYASTPVAVVGGLTFRSLSAGGFHTCGVTTDGAAYCWGWNYDGEVGDGANGHATSVNTGVFSPVAVAGGLVFVSVTAGYEHSCALTSGGAAYCWGNNGFGQLGDSSRDSATDYLHPTPVAVVGGLAFASLTAGDIHTCGLTSGGVAYCWGDLNRGGTDVGRYAPVAVTGDLTFASLSAGSSETYGVTGSGSAYWWIEASPTPLRGLTDQRALR